MPYITPHIRATAAHFPVNAGELNFAISEVIAGYLARRGESYQTYNDIIGALDGLKMELYARRVRPYEDTKIDINGDVSLFGGGA